MPVSLLRRWADVAVSLALLIGLSPALAHASTYYLSGEGSDRAAGTLREPWRTIEHADEVVAAGDVVYVRAGTYGATATRTAIAARGTGMAPISWLRYPGDAQPTVLGQLRITGSYNRVSGLLFDGPTGSIPGIGEEVPVWINAPGVQLDHSEVRESAWHAGVFVSNAEGFAITHDYIHNNGVTYNLDHGIYVSSGSGSVENNLIADNFAWGVQLYPEASGITVNHNTIVGNGRGGVIVANESSEDLVVNNIVADNHEYGIRGYNLTGRGNAATHNLLWGQEVETTGEGMEFSEDTVADPLFVSESDFHLEAGSPATGQGTSPTVEDDLDGVARGVPADLGAYELVSTTPEFHGAASASVDASTTLTIARPTEATAGDVLVAEVVNRGGATISAPAGWRQIRDTFRGPSDHMTTFYKLAAEGEPSSYAFTSTDANGKAGGIAAWNGVDAGSPVATSSGTSGSGTTVTATAVTTEEPDTPVLFIAGIMDQPSASPPSGFSERWDVASAGRYNATAESASIVQAEAGSSGSQSARAGSAGGGWAAQLIALNPAE